ncbi:PaaI family thioesterase [Neisseriaceae bacterium PsAf]|nr:PaaI family thioesterase [Neisseriaceae bacterium PsAf]MCV2502934.1 PaaI family thioesterase [Neisseriaceae bacterium]
MQSSQVYTYYRDLYLNIPHCQDICLQFVSGDVGTSQIALVDWNEHLIDGEHESGLHSGVITTLVDTTGAIAVAAKLEDFQDIATLDLRIDFLNSAKSYQPVYAKAYCYESDRQVFFVRVRCYQEEESHPLALGTLTYMSINSRKKNE